MRGATPMTSSPTAGATGRTSAAAGSSASYSARSRRRTCRRMGHGPRDRLSCVAGHRAARARGRGGSLVGEGDAALESPECYLRLPVTKGDTWETAHRLDGETYATKYTVGEEAEIEVPAGKFRCIRIESEFVFNGVSYTRTRWR